MRLIKIKGRSILILLMVIPLVMTLQLPDIHWRPDDPMYHDNLCIKGRSIIAKENDVLNLICPNRDLNNRIVNTSMSLPNHFSYNIYVTEDKDLFDERKVEHNGKKAILLHTCRERLSSTSYGAFKATVTKKTLHISPFGIGSSRMKFRNGYRYYFFTTADGTDKSLKNAQCPKTRRHLYFILDICKSCLYTWSRCVPNLPMYRSRSDSKSTPIYYTKENKDNSMINTVITFGCTFFGMIIGIAIHVAYDKYKALDKRYQPASVSDTDSGTQS